MKEIYYGGLIEWMVHEEDLRIPYATGWKEGKIFHDEVDDIFYLSSKNGTKVRLNHNDIIKFMEETYVIKLELEEGGLDG